MIDEMDPEGAAKMFSLKELMEFAKLLQGEELQGRYGTQPGVDESGYPDGKGMAQNVPGARTEQEEEQLEQEGQGGGAAADAAESEPSEFSLDRLKMALARAK
jgi:hypothetical protein